VFKIHQTAFILITRQYRKNKQQEQTINTRNKSFQRCETTYKTPDLIGLAIGEGGATPREISGQGFSVISKRFSGRQRKMPLIVSANYCI